MIQGIFKAGSIYLFAVFLLGSCRAQTNDEKIAEVEAKVVSAIKTNDLEEFLSLIPSDLSSISKTKEMVKLDLNQFHELFQNYLQGKKVKLVNTDLYNFLGQKLIKIPIYDQKIDSIQTDRLYIKRAQKISIHLYFGPPNIKPLDRLSGYKLDINDENMDSFQPLEHWKQNTNP